MKQASNEGWITPQAQVMPLNTRFEVSPALVCSSGLREAGAHKEERPENGFDGMANEVFMHGIFGPLAGIIAAAEGLKNAAAAPGKPSGAAQIDVSARADVKNRVLMAAPMRKPQLN